MYSLSVHLSYLNNTRGEGQTPGLCPGPKLLLSPVFRVVWPRQVTLGSLELSHHVGCWCRITRIAQCLFTCKGLRLGFRPSHQIFMQQSLQYSFLTIYLLSYCMTNQVSRSVCRQVIRLAGQQVGRSVGWHIFYKDFNWKLNL